MYNCSKELNRVALTKALLEVVQEIQTKLLAEDDEEREWLIKNSPNPVIAELISEMTIMMLHVLDAIGKLEPVNGITISKQFGFSKGSISKITRRMADKNIIQFEYIPHNKKEILFRTTPLGQEIYQLHLAMHRQIDIGVDYFLKQYSETELKFLVHVLSGALHTSWLYPEFIEDPTENNLSNEYRNDEIHNAKISSSTINADYYEIIDMIKKLEPHDLKEAKVILSEHFFE
ncbi:MarR family transcriptional regulator [Paenibacillus sp. ACRSA]|uniref:MarR family transcriptional regulator n=1 Tax=Paenibacillus sp. ACRSA TaxID=2918211 RepID=UPI001EF50247|nr:MarR family transcriptional regulator [Paenibacillus sp. ACRSA]MCG7379429.1 MarR family transcriptional regulator [Paenibacillus sp. ACRSA]